ncbi:YybH family protein [Stenotrophomonas rhizophila]
MRALVLALIFPWLALTASPLAAQVTPAAEPQAELPDVPLPAELDRVLRDYERAWNAGNAAGLAALFAEDGVILQSNQPPVRGRAAIEAAYAGQGPGGSLRLRAFAHAVSGTVGYVIGGYGFGGGRRDAGKFTLALQRAADGRWMIFSDMDNTNAAPQTRKPINAPHPEAAPAARS